MSLRVIDAGTVDAWRSQALWHGIASAMRDDTPTTLSFCRPGEPYVGLGYHRRLDELDVEACQRLGLPIIRRQIGGGPVYLDQDQLFFQLTLPAAQAPPRVDHLYQRYLEPAVTALRRLGLPVERNGLNDLAIGSRKTGSRKIGSRKISGTAAGQIGSGVTVVGNILFRFPHHRMMRILALPSAGMREQCTALMRRHVTSVAAEGGPPIDPSDAREALVTAYAEALGLTPRATVLRAEEEAAIGAWEQRFQTPEWLAGPRRTEPSGRQVKISADAWVFATTGPPPGVELSVVDGKIARLVLDRAFCNGTADAMHRALSGQDARYEVLERRLEPFGQDGRQLLALLQPGLTNR